MKQAGHDEITRFFRQVLSEVNEALRDLDIRDERAWELARRLHELWREALRRASDPDLSSPVSHSKGHPAMEELLQMIDVEVER